MCSGRTVERCLRDGGARRSSNGRHLDRCLLALRDPADRQRDTQPGLSAAVFGNGLANGDRYFADVPSSSLLDGLDGAMAETFVRDPTAPAEDFRGRWEWREDVRMLTDVAKHGVRALSMTKVWTEASSRQRTALHRYALGTFLLGYQPGSGYFSFRNGHGLTIPGPSGR